VNNIRTRANNIGRPRLELGAARRRTLEKLALRIEGLTDELAEARAELAAGVRLGRSEGASIRAIAEAVGLSRPRVHEMLSETAEPLPTVESVDGRTTCG
jgi:hypothetical protein